ncbi:glycosyltransferase family 9 protein [Myxococcota bacterium]|nr:glycosyltransferase family 9 protein [Myxococcota bacterium]
MPHAASPLCLSPLPHPPASDRILVIRLGAVGDVARTLPAVSALRAAYPGAHLTWLVEPASRSLVEAQPGIDEVLVFPRDELIDALRRGQLARFATGWLRFVRRLRRRRFELAVDFHALAKSALLAYASGAPLRVSYARPYGREGSIWLATARARLPPPPISRFARNLGLVAFLGVAVRPAPAPLRVDPEVRRRLAQALGGGPGPVILHPGTSPGTPHKRWPTEDWATVARTLASDGLRVLVSCGVAPDERAAAAAIVAAADGAAAPAPETADLEELAALLAQARLFLGSDSGPLHIASLVGTPVVQLIGPTHPIENAPDPGTPSRSVRVPVACSPCRRGCAAAVCMTRIRPDAVVAAARSLLAASGPG